MDLFHIISAADLATFESSGCYSPLSLRQEGFIHLSYASQISGVWERYYQGQSDLYLLQIDPSQLAAEVVVEDTAGSGEAFPHLYGALAWSSVSMVTPLADWLSS